MPVRKGRLKPADEERIRKNYEYLLDEIDARYLTNELFSKDVLTKDDKDEINSNVKRKVRTELLLDKILESGPGDSYDIFIDVLTHDYEHVVNKLAETELSMNSVPSIPKPYQWYEAVSADIKQQVINDSNASRISTKLGENWELLMFQLGLSRIEIEREKKENHNDTIRITHLLIKWRQRVVQATVDKLMKCLMELEDTMTIDWEGLKCIVESFQQS